MASWMVHLRIADEILKRMEGLDETAFVIGNIAPDSGVPNEDWSKYFPPKNVSHFKTRPDDELFFDVDEFKKQYFSDEKIKGYDKRHYSFFLGYYVHLLSDIEWTVNYSATSNRASCFNHYCVGYDIHNSASYTVSTGV